MSVGTNGVVAYHLRAASAQCSVVYNSDGNFAYCETRSTDARVAIDLVHACSMVDTGVWRTVIYIHLTVQPNVAGSTCT